MRNFFRIAVSFTLITVFSSCGSFKLGSLGKTTDNYNCHGDPDDGKTIYSPIEESLIRQGALKSRKINMESGIGMMEKTVRLFVLNKNEIRMSFHFMHPIDLEIKNFGYAIQGDNGKLVGGEMQVDSRFSIGGMTEEYAHLIYPAEKMTHLFEDKQVSILVDDMLFNIPFNCRETFREIHDKYGTR